MCGINGVFSFSPSAGAVCADEIRATRDAMVSRGPDDAGLWVATNRRIGLGHRRLSIIDLTSMGAQPMSLPDGSLRIVFNGEIYNYPTLKRRLEAQGCRFRSHSDTEVILHLYRLHGAKALDYLRGMFALAIWDDVKNELFLARDEFGIKPLFYSIGSGQLRFASEAKALVAGGTVSSELSNPGVTGFFLWGSIPEPFSIYRDIRLLEAGHILTVREGGTVATRRYCDLGVAFNRSLEHAADVPAGEEDRHAREALLDSVQHHLVSDVPVGTFLSAGLDSTAIASLVRESGVSDCLTVTLAFDEFRNHILDESPLAAKVAEQLRFRHCSHVLSIGEVENELATFFSAMDQPTVDGLNTWFVAKAASNAGLKVVLSGLGGDELLGGYDTFHRLPALVASARKWRALPRLSRLYRSTAPFFSKQVRNDPRRAGWLEHGTSLSSAYALERGVFMPWELAKILDPDIVSTGLAELQEIEQQQISPALADPIQDFWGVSSLEISRYMRNQLLRDSDWIGMAFSLEIRVPLVDKVLFAALSGLAATGRLGRNKAVLARVLSSPYADELLARPKTGFAVPIWRWLSHSGEFAAWRDHPFLRRPHTKPVRRWAYNVMSHFAGDAWKAR